MPSTPNTPDSADSLDTFTTNASFCSLSLSSSPVTDGEEGLAEEVAATKTTGEAGELGQMSFASTFSVDTRSLARLRLQSPDSPNFFTWRFTHDWCLTKGHLRCSGEDHFSALKPPRAAERCSSLARWTLDTYPYLQAEGWDWRYGVYSETPDHAPLVGTTNPESRVCYLLGCNASGQAPLSFAASLVPGLLGYKQLDAEELDLFRVLTIRRFALLPSVMNKQFV